MWSRKRLRHQTDNGDKRCVTASHWRRRPRSNVGSKDTRSTCSRLRVSHRRSSSLCLSCLDFRVSGCGLGEPGSPAKQTRWLCFFADLLRLGPDPHGADRTTRQQQEGRYVYMPSWWVWAQEQPTCKAQTSGSVCWLATPVHRGQSWPPKPQIDIQNRGNTAPNMYGGLFYVLKEAVCPDIYLVRLLEGAKNINF